MCQSLGQYIFHLSHILLYHICFHSCNMLFAKAKQTSFQEEILIVLIVWNFIPHAGVKSSSDYSSKWYTFQWQNTTNYLAISYTFPLFYKNPKTPVWQGFYVALPFLTFYMASFIFLFSQRKLHKQFYSYTHFFKPFLDYRPISPNKYCF